MATEGEGSSNTERMEALMQRLDSAENHINANNQNTITNASKDRLRVKKRKDEIAQMQADFESNVRVDPEEMSKVSLIRLSARGAMVELFWLTSYNNS